MSKKKEKDQQVKNYFELENSHLNNLINFLYKNEMATIEQLAKKQKIFGDHLMLQLNKIQVEKNKIRERMKIRVIRKIMEIKEKFDNNKLDTLEKGMALIVTFVTILIICQILPLAFAVFVKFGRG